MAREEIFNDDDFKPDDRTRNDQNAKERSAFVDGLHRDGEKIADSFRDHGVISSVGRAIGAAVRTIITFIPRALISIGLIKANTKLLEFLRKDEAIERSMKDREKRDAERKDKSPDSWASEINGKEEKYNERMGNKPKEKEKKAEEQAKGEGQEAEGKTDRTKTRESDRTKKPENSEQKKPKQKDHAKDGAKKPENDKKPEDKGPKKNTQQQEATQQTNSEGMYAAADAKTEPINEENVQTVDEAATKEAELRNVKMQLFRNLTEELFHSRGMNLESEIEGKFKCTVEAGGISKTLKLSDVAAVAEDLGTMLDAVTIENAAKGAGEPLDIETHISNEVTASVYRDMMLWINGDVSEIPINNLPLQGSAYTVGIKENQISLYPPDISIPIFSSPVNELDTFVRDATHTIINGIGIDPQEPATADEERARKAYPETSQEQKTPEPEQGEER